MKESNKMTQLLKALVYIQVAFVSLLVLVLAFAQPIGTQLSVFDALEIFSGAVIIELAVFGILGCIIAMRD